MGSLHRFNLKLLKSTCGVDTIYETGTGHGLSLRWAAQCGLSRLISVEEDADTLAHARRNLAETPGVELLHGDSHSLLRSVPIPGSGARLFFLDAHFVGGADFKGAEAYRQSLLDKRSFPLLEELDLLSGKFQSEDWLVIDDARLYYDGVFAGGVCPEWARQWNNRPELETRLAGFHEHDKQLLRQDHGYVIVSPKNARVNVRDLVRVVPGDPPNNGQVSLVAGVPGVTSISMQRRLADSRFVTRYFRGFGLDVGGGVDPLCLFGEFFPLATCISTYDWADGDAQFLCNVSDNAFDFVYSSHCLEHLRDPRVALTNWIRIVKPGGFIVVQVPDEDLYEKGHWPSKYNPDHKYTFTVQKSASWSPVSINVLDLLRSLSDRVQVVSVGLMDHSYRYGYAELDFDQTRTPAAECGIEFVLRKL